MIEKIVERILRSSVYDVTSETPLSDMPTLSKKYGRNIVLKREDLQPIFSFKIRGAYNKIAKLHQSSPLTEVVTSSAGNHAQGVAYSAKKLRIKAKIFMPKITPSIKISAVKNLGAQVVLVGDNYDEAYAEANAYATKNNLPFIHPYDDLDVIAGQGTIGMEVMRQTPGTPKVVFIPIGGGGLIAGLSAYLKFVDPSIKVIGIEPEDSPAFWTSMRENKRSVLKHVGIFADGVAVKQVGKAPYDILKHTVDDVILVKTDEICAAIKDIFDDTRSIAEPSGALAVAGLKKYILNEEKDQASGTSKNIKKSQLTQKADGKSPYYVAINSGANINFDRLRHVSERSEIGEHKEGLFAVTIPEKPGSFATFCKCLGKRSVTEFNYRMSDPEKAHIFVGVELKDGLNERTDLMEMFKSCGFPAEDLSENELAKIHVRHMVGGKSPNITNEKIYRFQFPEYPGALLTFLTKLGNQWNISLFHYRNHGAAYGRVLAGIQVPKKEEKAFQSFLKETGFFSKNETENIAYNLFL